MMRRSTPEQRNGLKTAFKNLIFDLGGLEAAAACTRVGPSQLSDYGNVHNPKHAPADVLLDLEALGRPVVSSALVACQGYALVAVKLLRPKDALAEIAARIGQDAGRLFADLARVLSHAKPSPKEVAQLRTDLRELMQAASEAEGWLALHGEAHK